MQQCQRTFVPHCVIDYEEAISQHAEYCRLLQNCDVSVTMLNANCDWPDCTFVEDTAIVLDELAVMASMGADSRRGEVAAIEEVLRHHRVVRHITFPATIEGGDVQRIGRTLLVGVSRRTNQLGVEAFEKIVRPHGYRVVPVSVRGCLHFKTACTALDDSTLLINPAWINAASLREFRLVSIPNDEPWAANTLRLNELICLPAAHVQTADMIHSLGFEVRTVELGEFSKAEAGITCLSIILEGCGQSSVPELASN